MTARTHDAFAFASLVTAAVIYPPIALNMPTLFTAVVANVVGALIPDMDQASNRLWDLFPAGNIVGKIFRHVFIGHRSISHSILGGFILYKLLEFLLPILFNENYIDIFLIKWAVMIGFGSHLLADAMTKDGIPLFFPFSWKLGIPPIEFFRVRTGSWMENFIVLPSVGAYLFWFIGENQNKLIGIVQLLNK